MKLLYIDLDGVIADFVSAMNAHSLRENPLYDKEPDTIPGLFRNLKTVSKFPHKYTTYSLKYKF